MQPKRGAICDCDLGLPRPPLVFLRRECLSVGAGVSTARRGICNIRNGRGSPRSKSQISPRFGCKCAPGAFA